MSLKRAQPRYQVWEDNFGRGKANPELAAESKGDLPVGTSSIPEFDTGTKAATRASVAL